MQQETIDVLTKLQDKFLASTDEEVAAEKEATACARSVMASGGNAHWEATIVFGHSCKAVAYSACAQDVMRALDGQEEP